LRPRYANTLNVEFVGGLFGTGSAVSKSGHGLVRDARWADGPGATYIRCSNREEGGRWIERKRERERRTREHMVKP
jgi:hypothetical protein